MRRAGRRQVCRAVVDVERWNESRDGPVTEVEVRGRLERRGYAVSRYTYAPGTTFRNTHTVWTRSTPRLAERSESSGKARKCYSVLGMQLRFPEEPFTAQADFLPPFGDGCLPPGSPRVSNEVRNVYSVCINRRSRPGIAISRHAGQAAERLHFRAASVQIPLFAILVIELVSRGDFSGDVDSDCFAFPVPHELVFAQVPVEELLHKVSAAVVE